ncbi:hypothetical protein KBD69_04320 [Candidatus Woesebacteria bacterium]|nr:hypothetical protein [Candidatus Woesebacteria bacterium]
MVKLILNEREVLAKNSLMLLFSFLTVGLVNMLVIYIANFLFPMHVVLGTMSLTPFWALMLATTELSIWLTAIIPLVYYYEWKNKRNLTDKEWMGLYFIANLVLVWGVTRFADIYGFGVSSWVVVVALAVVLDFVQGIGMMKLSKVKIK